MIAVDREGQMAIQSSRQMVADSPRNEYRVSGAGTVFVDHGVYRVTCEPQTDASRGMKEAGGRWYHSDEWTQDEGVVFTHDGVTLWVANARRPVAQFTLNGTVTIKPSNPAMVTLFKRVAETHGTQQQRMVDHDRPTGSDVSASFVAVV